MKKFVFVFSIFFLANLFGQVTVTVTPANPTAGNSNIHTISFTSTVGLPGDGQIVVLYPSGFDLNSILVVSSPSMDGTLNYSVSGDSVILTRSGGTAQTPGELETIRLANVTNATLASNYQITLRIKNSTGTILESGISSGFSVLPGPLDHFSVVLSGTSMIAGTPFDVTITAQDAFNNTVSSFSSTVDLSDLTGTLSPLQTTSFMSGVWAGKLIVRKTTTSNAITARAQGKAGTSNNFQVLPTILGTFTFDLIPSPQVAGNPFPIKITAQDTLGNVKTDFTGNVNLSEKTTTLEVQATGTNQTPSFTSGTWTGNILITQASKDIQLTATGGGVSGISGFFNVDPGPVDHFAILSIGDQSAGVPFPITVIALDANENVVTSFSGSSCRVNIAHTGIGTITPSQSGNFLNGIWTGNVTISRTQAGDRVTVNDGTGHTGQSNPFNVVASTVDHFVISSISPQTAGVAFSITIRAEDKENNLVTTFNGNANLKDETGTLSPDLITFSGGLWNGTVTITKSGSNRLTVTALGKSNVSNTFMVNPGSVTRFDITPILSPKTAGTAFSVTFIAKDAFDNVATGFNGQVTIEARTETGTIPVSPSTTGNFLNGTSTENLTITRAQNDVYISVRDANSHTGTSNRFNIQANNLHHFTISAIADQAAGLPFSVTVTAQDAYGNTVTGFSGTVNITHTGTGSITPTVSGNFIQGVWTGNVVISQVQSGDRVRVVRTGGAENGLSNPFSVTPSNVDHFVFSSIGTTQTAGVPFSVTIQAVDANQNVVSNFSGTVALLDETGTVSPSSVSFSNGVWTGLVTITRSWTGNTLTVTGVGKSGTSNAFTVYAGPVHSFQIAMISTPQTAGVPFPVTITAKDAYGNTATEFNHSVTLQEKTGTISPSATQPFLNGVRTEYVTISRSDQDIVITVSDGAGHTGLSNSFNVAPGALDRFSFDPIGNQIAGIPFTVRIMALDRYDNRVTSFTGTVNLSDLTGSIKPTQSGMFILGQWLGGVTIEQPMSNNQLTAIRTGGTERGNSNLFHVQAPPGIRTIAFTASRSAVTSGQTIDWSLTAVVQNLSSNNARLDSVQVRFRIGGREQTDYQVRIPQYFRHSGNAILGGNQQDTLSIIVDQTGRESGDVTVEFKGFFTDLVTGRTIQTQGFTGIVVQDSTRLQIDRIRVSQNEVTEGQIEDWTVIVYLTNRGGTPAVVDSARTNTYISFSIGEGWVIQRPLGFSNGGWILSGGQTDSLIYIIEMTGRNARGDCEIHATVTATELHTGRVVIVTTQKAGKGMIRIEAPGLLQIRSFDVIAPNPPYVNIGQIFKLRLVLDNEGEDAFFDVQAMLNSDGGSIFLDAPIKNIHFLSGGSEAVLEYEVQASSIPIEGEQFTISVTGYAENTKSLKELGTKTTVFIQRPCNLVVEKLIPSLSIVTGGQKDPWYVKVVVRNSGEAGLVFNTPRSEDLKFWNAGIFQTDYYVIPPKELTRGGLILQEGERDTLIYTVTSTGSMGGVTEIEAEIVAKDQNSLEELVDTGTGSVFVRSERAFRIISTQIDAPHKTEAGNGYVNIGQVFHVLVIIENGIGQRLQNIQVKLETNGKSKIENPILTLPQLKPSEWDSLYFSVKADSGETLSEIFTARIVEARFAGSGLLAPVGTALDSVAQAIIQTPPLLFLQVDGDSLGGLVSTGQIFTVRAKLLNTGSGDVRGYGGVRIELPTGYTLFSGTDTLQIRPDIPAEWKVKAPQEPTPTGWIAVSLYRTPLDWNTGEIAKVQNAFDRIPVATVVSFISSSVSFPSPLGAQDGVVSTGQFFVVKAEIRKAHVINVMAHLVLPSGYTTADHLQKNVLGNEVIWQVHAPEAPAPEQVIQVITQGEDSLQSGVIVQGTSGMASITTVRRAELVLNLAIVDPPDVAMDNTVSPGQEFTIEASLTNLGEAGIVGTAWVTLDSLPKGYTTSEPMTKSLENGKARWRIQAPLKQSGEAVSIRAHLSTLPFDENTGKEAYVRQYSNSVAVTIEGAWLAITMQPLPPEEPASIVPGQTGVKLMTLELENRGFEGANPIALESIRFQVEDRLGNPIPPSSVLSSVSVVNDTDSTEIYGILDDIGEENPIVVPFFQKPLVSVGKKYRISVCAGISEQPEYAYFRLNIPSGEDVLAKDMDSGNVVPVKSITGDTLYSVRSNPKKIFKPKTEPVLWNSPNPFGGPGKERTKITYYLEKNTGVTFSIFTLLGQKVWSISYPANDLEHCSPGVHEIYWDGRNGEGEKVLNGVYFLFMKTGDGKVEKTKIAIVK